MKKWLLLAVMVLFVVVPMVAGPGRCPRAFHLPAIRAYIDAPYGVFSYLNHDAPTLVFKVTFYDPLFSGVVNTPKAPTRQKLSAV